jgi:hypothetical protein
MPEYDISMHGIRVVLDPAYYGTPASRAPIDVEGTALSIIDCGKRGLDMMREGRFIELLCDPNYNGNTDVFVRWDTDEKEWFCGGSLLLRRAKGSFCSSIWTGDEGVQMDKRTFHELQPRTYKRREGLFDTHYGKQLKQYTTKAPQAVPAIYNDLLAMPGDGLWHRVVYQGVYSWGRTMPGGFEVKEDIPNATIFFVEEPTPAPPIENLWVGGDIEVGHDTMEQEHPTLIDTNYNTAHTGNTGIVMMGEPVQFDNIVIQNNAAPPMPEPPVPDVGGNTNAVGTTTTNHDWYEIGDTLEDVEDFDDDF